MLKFINNLEEINAYIVTKSSAIITPFIFFFFYFDNAGQIGRVSSLHILLLSRAEKPIPEKLLKIIPCDEACHWSEAEILCCIIIL